MKNRKRYENELEKRLWDEEWASFRVAGSGCVDHESADIVACKNGRTLIIEVKTTNKNIDNIGSEIYNDKQLREICGRSGPSSRINIIYALRDIGGGGINWYYKEIGDSEIEPLYKILEGSG